MPLKKLALLALLAASPAISNTIIVTGLNASLGVQQSLWFDQDGVAGQEYWVGAIIISLDGYPRDTFCVDLFTQISFDTYSSQLDTATSATEKRIGWLLQNQYPVTQFQAAAFQLALWDITHDNGDGFAAGAGRITQSTDAANPTDPTILAMALAYEASSAGKSATYGVIYHNVTFSGAPVQTLVGRPVTDGGPSPKPEPANVILIGSGLVLIAFGRRRARRTIRRGNLARQTSGG